MSHSLARPTTLGELPAWRQPLLDAPEGSPARRFGERLRDLQAAHASGDIDFAEAKSRAVDIMSDLTDLDASEMLDRHYQLINDDLGLQYNVISRNAARHAIEILIDPDGPECMAVLARGNVQDIARQFGVTRPADLYPLERLPATTCARA